MKKALSLILSVIMLLSITAGMDVTAFADTPVTSVAVTGVKNPYSGDSPVFALSTNSSAYSIDTDTYTNGVSWYDATDRVELTEGDVFMTGHYYTVKVRIKLESGYYIDDSQVECTVDGTVASLEQAPGETSAYDVTLRFPECNGNINTVKLKGSDNFYAGGTPSYSFTPEESAYIADQRDNDGREICNATAYYDLTDSRYVLSGDKFIFGHSYTKEMAVSADNGFTLNGLSSATYNGERASITPHFRNRDNHTDVEIILVTLGKCLKNINSCSVTGISDQYVYTYSGSAKKAVKAVYDGDKKLVSGTDYTVTYKNNINAGTASYVITGIGNYTGIWSGTFKITRKALSKSAKIKMKYDTCVYDGNVHKQTVKVYDGTKLLKNNTDYTITYSSSSPRAVNNYSAKITFRGNYSGSKTVSYSIIPQKTSFLKTVTATASSIRLKWKQQKKQTSGYEIEYSTQAAFKSGNKSVFVKNNATVSKAVTGLKRNKKYYFRIRTYKDVKKNGRTVRVYSAWSGVKEAKTRR